jgi:hypothetical protein
MSLAILALAALTARDLIRIILVIAIIAVVVYVVTTKIPMDEVFRNIIRGVAILFVCLWLLNEIALI